MVCICGGVELPNSDDMKTLNAALDRIDDAIGVLRTQRALLARRRNTTLPVSKLPPELLTTIFCTTSSKRIMCRGTDWIEGWRPLSSDPSSALILSHVSHGFRRVALTTATLWSTLDASRGKTLVRQLLARAGQTLSARCTLCGGCLF
jgi:hypothetical protein